MKKINIAIDGPSGVGKSTISDRIAEKLNMRHLDTGAMYRCVAYYVKKNHVDYENKQALQEALDQIHIRFDGDRVLLNGEDVSQAIRMNEVSMMASITSALPEVRQKLVSLQQEAVKDKGFIVDGRDICSVVLPDAEVKLYMDATPEARAGRRYKEYIKKGIEADYETIFQDIVARDYQDTHRAISPLKKADDAILVDTSDLTIDEVVETVLDIIDKEI
ncbi:(d)CMP kinase [Catenisphaera adipataccumulans]|jgi:cytidylate kinase|uniref:Cytidylate kinase n=1 Tax=Catenisphaera adipataccumulans TaxID=700500 RepID=A0A7W8D1A7_9FIRM|nr:(d)CMP kinase [Catenisphaera adipataccumulans]MBB5183725.1 cytidylate kinase [Catenisphaera adipataccumulans]